ncbi:MAG: hypothetical protein P4L26_02475 [Terracidiphilus sp.]|nr:hypothetical protein [Terracidiphilus sp.]
MHTLRKFISFCAVLAAVAFLGTTSLALTDLAPQVNLHGLPNGAGEFLQVVLNDARLSSQRTVAELTPQLKFMTSNAGVFVKHNLVTARLQFAGMANSVSARFTRSDWLPTGAPNWMKGGATAAVQKASGKANDLANKVPVVDRAISSASNSMKGVRDAVSNSSSF